MFFSVQSNFLISRNCRHDAMPQYRYSNFSDVFCLNCIFAIDDVVKQLVSRSFLKYGLSAVTMAARKNYFFKLNQIFTVLVSLNSL